MENKQIIIDFNNPQLNESFLYALGGAIKMLLGAIMDGGDPDVLVKGSKAQTDAFISSLAGEKKYIEAAKKFGLTDPKTMANKSRAVKAAMNFTRVTGIPFPFH